MVFVQTQNPILLPRRVFFETIGTGNIRKEIAYTTGCLSKTIVHKKYVQEKGYFKFPVLISMLLVRIFIQTR